MFKTSSSKTTRPHEDIFYKSYMKTIAIKFEGSIFPTLEDCKVAYKTNYKKIGIPVNV